MHLPYSQLPDPTDKFEIYEEIAQGVNAKVFRAKELDNDRVVALKIQHYDEEHQVSIEEEYRTLRDYCAHPNLPEFYGVYKLSKPNGPDEIWFVMEVSLVASMDRTKVINARSLFYPLSTALGAPLWIWSIGC